MYKNIVLALTLLSLILLSGCSFRAGDFTVMSTKNIYCKNVDLTQCEQYPGVVGKDIRFWGIGSNIKDAADKALEQHNGNFTAVPLTYEQIVVNQLNITCYEKKWLGST